MTMNEFAAAPVSWTPNESHGPAPVTAETAVHVACAGSGCG